MPSAKAGAAFEIFAFARRRPARSLWRLPESAAPLSIARANEVRVETRDGALAVIVAGRRNRCMRARRCGRGGGRHAGRPGADRRVAASERAGRRAHRSGGALTLTAWPAATAAHTRKPDRTAAADRRRVGEAGAARARALRWRRHAVGGAGAADRGVRRGDADLRGLPPARDGGARRRTDGAGSRHGGADAGPGDGRRRCSSRRTCRRSRSSCRRRRGSAWRTAAPYTAAPTIVGADPDAISQLLVQESRRSSSMPRGDRLAGRYRLLRPIGRGHAADVYLAQSFLARRAGDRGAQAPHRRPPARARNARSGATASGVTDDHVGRVLDVGDDRCRSWRWSMSRAARWRRAARSGRARRAAAAAADVRRRRRRRRALDAARPLAHGASTRRTCSSAGMAREAGRLRRIDGWRASAARPSSTRASRPIGAATSLP